MTETEAPVREAAAEVHTPRERGPARSAPVFVIRPASRLPHLDFGELWHYRELLATFVWRDLAVRYKQTSLGVAWALLVPSFTAAIAIVVFGKFAKFPSGNMPYPTLVLSGLLPMQYFTSALTNSSTSLVSNVALVTKVYFPRALLPLAAVIVPVVDLLLAFAVLVPLMVVYGTWPDGPEVVLAPLFLALALVTALGIGFLLSALNVRYRDVPYAIPVFLQVLPLVSGVYFALGDLPAKWQWLLSLNPMSAVISGWRWALVGGPTPNFAQVALGATVAGILFLLGLAFFRSSEPRFADTI